MINKQIHHPQRLLVTGAAGFIGSNFIHYWLKTYCESNIIALDSLTYAGNLRNLPDDNQSLEFIHADICNTDTIEKILSDQCIDTIVHFAAETHVDRSIRNPDKFINTNIVGTHSLLKAAKHVWLDNSKLPTAHRFQHISTDEVYGSLDFNEPAFKENTPYAPSSPYAASKAAADHLVSSYQNTYQLNTVISVCSNNYGPYQYPEKLIPLTLVNILHGKPIPIYGHGLNVRDWLYVDDHCRGIDLCIKRGREGETYNIGGGEEHSNINIVIMLCKVIDELFSRKPEMKLQYRECPAAKNIACKSLITYVTNRPGHDNRYAINETKIQQELGHNPKQDFTSGIQKTIQWYLNNSNWWQAILSDNH